MPAFSLSRGATLQIMAPAFPKVGTGSGSVHCSLLTGARTVPDRCRTGSPFPATKPFLKRAGLTLLTEIDVNLAAV